MMVDRRQVLTAGAGALATVAFGTISPAHANNAQDLIKAFTGGKQATEGKVKLDLPEIAENGNTVPMTVSVESPMTDASHVTDVLVVGDGNPNGGVVSVQFSPPNGAAEANTRVPPAAPHNIIAVPEKTE